MNVESANTTNIETIFGGLFNTLEAEQNLRDEIRKQTKDLDSNCRRLSIILQQIHTPKGIKVADLCARARETLPPIANSIGSMRDLIKNESYFRFHEHWRGSVQLLVGQLALLVWLESNRLITPQETDAVLGLSPSSGGFTIELEDYLIGLCSVPSELSRLCVNSVIAGDYSMPLRIVTFVEELYAGFRMLNLKNDNLRKRYDGIKYDLKKIEEVVYDISIRKLAAAAPPAASAVKPDEKV